MLRSRVLWKVHSKDHAVAASRLVEDGTGDQALHLSGTQLAIASPVPATVS
jgi:hypothetical protein